MVETQKDIFSVFFQYSKFEPNFLDYSWNFFRPLLTFLSIFPHFMLLEFRYPTHFDHCALVNFCTHLYLRIVVCKNPKGCSLWNRNNFIEWRFWGHSPLFINIVLHGLKLSLILVWKWILKYYLFLEEKMKKELSLGMGLVFFVLEMDGLWGSDLRPRPLFSIPLGSCW